MYHLRLLVLLIIPLDLLPCVNAHPSNRYLSPISSGQESAAAPPEREEDWILPELGSNPFLRLVGARPQRELAAGNSHHLEKRKCNTATCVTQRLADFLVRSSNTIGTVYAPTNVGSSTYGKRELLEPRSHYPL